MSSEREET